MVFQKSNNQICDTNYTMRISTEDKARLKEFANELNMSVPTLIKMAVNELEKSYIKNRDK